MSTSKYIYLDSNIYMSNYLELGGEMLEVVLSDALRVGYKPLTTSIVQNEIKSFLNKKIESFKDVAKYLHTIQSRLSCGDIETEVNIEDFSLKIERDLSDDFSADLSAWFKKFQFKKIEILDNFESTDLIEIMDHYFSEIGLFSKSKKYEFNDAVQIKLLQGHIRISDELIFVSNDKEFRDAVEKEFTNSKLMKSTSELSSHIIKNSGDVLLDEKEKLFLEALNEFMGECGRWPDKLNLKNKIKSIDVWDPTGVEVDDILRRLDRWGYVKIKKSKKSELIQDVRYRP